MVSTDLKADRKEHEIKEMVVTQILYFLKKYLQKFK